MDNIILPVYNVVGSPYCVEAEDGQTVFIHLKEAFEANRNIELSFLNVEILTTAFLNTAVGQLYRDFSEEKVKELLSVSNLTATGAIALRRVVDTAKQYYKDPEAMDRSIREVLGE